MSLSRSRKTALLLALLGAAGAAPFGCVSVGGPVVIVRAEPAAARQEKPIKLATFNLFNRPWDREQRLARAREEILALDADVVALQEVSQGWLAGEDAKQMLASLPYPHQAYFMLERWGPLGENGLYLLSRWPIEEASGRVYEVNRAFNHKGFMAVTVRAPQVKLRLVNLHQASTRRASITVPQATCVAATLPAPASGELLVVLGDFNARLDEPPVSLLLAAGGLVAAQAGDPAPAASWAPYGEACSAPGGERIDHILLSRPSRDQPWHVVRQGVLQPRPPYPSDHCPVWTELGVEGADKLTAH